MDECKIYNSLVFEGNFKLSTASYPKNFSVETDHFSLLPNNSVSFYFKACHRKLHDDYFNLNISDLRLKLIWETTANLPSSLQMMVDTKILFHDGSLFKDYGTFSNIKIGDQKSITFPKVLHSIYDYNHDYGVHSDDYAHSEYRIPLQSSPNHDLKMKQGHLTVKCKLSFILPSTSPPNFAGNLISVYDSSLFSDFVFTVGGESFPVHKVILVAHSPVFMKMLTQDCLESKENRVTITDSSPEAFESFLKYLYSGEIKNKSWPSVKDLYVLADKYDVQVLKQDCVDLIVPLMSMDLVCEILNTAYLHDDSNLKTIAKQFATIHIQELIPREDWNKLVVTNPIIGYEVAIPFVPKLK